MFRTRRREEGVELCEGGKAENGIAGAAAVLFLRELLRLFLLRESPFLQQQKRLDTLFTAGA